MEKEFEGTIIIDTAIENVLTYKCNDEITFKKLILNVKDITLKNKEFIVIDGCIFGSIFLSNCRIQIHSIIR